MNSSDPRSNRDSMSDLLQQWKIKSELPPRFQENVWRSIERSEARQRTSVSMVEMVKRSLERLFPHPAMALAYLSVMLVAGGIAGMAHGEQENQRMGARLSLRYVQSVDPYQGNP